MMQKNPVPVEILFEILLRWPAKSLGRCVCVSKLWARIIRSEDFVRWFSFRSSPKKQPRFLFAFNDRPKGCQENKAELETVQKSAAPEKIMLDIMSRLPAKSIARFACLSKLWARTIHGEVFIKQPRFLFASNDKIKGYQENWHFFSKPTLVSTPLPGPCPPLLTNQFLELWNVLTSRNSPHVAEEEKPSPEFLSSTVCHIGRSSKLENYPMLHSSPSLRN